MRLNRSVTAILVLSLMIGLAATLSACDGRGGGKTQVETEEDLEELYLAPEEGEQQEN